MKRLFAGLAAWLIVVAPATRAQSPSELARTAALAATFQNPDGGFAASPGGPSSLGATSSSIRILKNTGGSIPDVLACIRYVKSCFNPDLGGFAPTPGGKPDVGTTASGLMAVAELKVANDAMVQGGIRLFGERAKSYEEVRIAVAGLEAVKMTAPEFGRWTEEILKGRNPDGTWGEGDGKAYETGGKAVALLRMGYALDKKEAIVAFLRAAQRPEGGWSKGPGAPDLDATYRIMRAFFMLNQKPDLERLTAFIARCRQPDGSYATRPGPEGKPGGTYFATIVLRWARVLGGEPALPETAGFVPIFNGKDLTGWEGDTSLWSARDGALVGSSAHGLSHNDFLATEATYDNCVVKATFRLMNNEGNSGIQFRSVRVPGHEMSGFQADIGWEHWGCLYDESRRNRVLAQASPEALRTLRKTDWNQYTIAAKGDQIRLSLNGVTSVEYVEKDPAIAKEGRIAVQMHSGGPIEVRFKDIYLQRLPRPSEDAANTPGFHVRRLKTGDAGRKYAVSIPQGYDGTKAFPVILYLHGSGQRGDDGIQPTQVGIGPAVFNHPERFPAIVVFPQARETWTAGSADARAAIDALGEVLDSLKTDRSRLIITGQSMGGRGAWEVAASNPQRFSAVVPVCAIGKTDSARPLASLPVWAFVGDADRDETVLNSRAMVEAISAAGGKTKYTEYRDVGHNCWDRAYNDPALTAWMLVQSRP